MRFLVLDSETTTKNDANPFTPENKLCIISWATANKSGWEKIEYDDEPYAQALRNIQSLVDNCDIIVGFNIKFDLHWFRRYGIDFSRKRIWDCQLVGFTLGCMSEPYPSLVGECAKHGIVAKSNSVSDYWAKGIDTRDIPLDELTLYGEEDAKDTRQLYSLQLAEVQQRSRPFQSLISLHNADLLVTQEMEWNGILLDVEQSLKEGAAVAEEVKALGRKLEDFFKVDWVNFESPKQLSALLFGGTITKEWREQVGVYKTGAKIGEPRYAVRREEHTFSRLVEPLKGTGLAAGGWSTSEDHLRSLDARSKPTRAVLDILLRRSKLEKLRGTYYEGLPSLLSTMGWTGNVLHGQINHCVTRTGRTSSSKPNLQNMPPELDRLFRSRFVGGKVIGFDAKGLEWVCVVYQSQDPVGIEEVTAGVDQHEMNKERFGLPDKRTAKYFVFRLIYGGTAYTYTMDPDFYWISRKEKFWQEVMDKFYEKYLGIRKVHKQWVQEAVETGELTTPTGRRFKFYMKPSGDPPRTQILNYPVQSFGADLMAIARVSLYRRMKSAGLRSLLINTIHDSIVLDILPEEWYTIHTMTKEVFADIPKNFEKLFGSTFNLPMKVEAKSLNGEEITA